MSNSSSQNSEETTQTLLSNRSMESGSLADPLAQDEESPEESKAAAEETVIQSEVSMEDATVPDTSVRKPTVPTLDAPSNFGSPQPPADLSMTMVNRSDNGADVRSDVTTEHAERTARGEDGTAADLDITEERTVVGPVGRGAESSFSVEPTMVGTDSQPSATVPNRADASRQSYVTVEETIAGDAASGDTARPLSEGGLTAPKIGRFEILKVLGQGAFGTVYLAHDPHLDRKVAVKVAKTGVLSGKQDVDRFMREARSAAQLRHPHIVPVYEFERLPHSSFIAYEYIEGTTLGHLMKERQKLTCEEAADYIAKIASALDYAHSHGIVHRDMKPENVLIDKEGEPHIADFGLARRDDGDTLRTREGLFMGTPSYMSPEQAGGKAHLADGRSDIWSLGVMLHEMLTGVRPFRGTVTEVLVAVQNEEPPPLRQIDKSLPRDLETICQKCLTKDLNQRYQRAQDLADELRRWRDGHPIQARPISVPHRVWRMAKRNPQIAIAVGSVVAMAIILAIVGVQYGIVKARSLQVERQARIDRALAQLEALETAVPASVPDIIDGLEASRGDIAPQLEAAIASPDSVGRPRARLLLARAILNDNGTSPDSRAEPNLDDVLPQLLESDARELIMLTRLIGEHGYESAVETRLWRTAQREVSDSPRKFRALAALAALDSDVPVWSSVTSDFVTELLTMNPIELSDWLPALRPVRDELEGPLTERFMTGDDHDKRVMAAQVLAELFSDSLETLVALIPRAKPAQLAPLLVALRPQADRLRPRLKDELNSLIGGLNPDAPETVDESHYAQITNVAVALLRMDDAESVWPLLHASPDPEVRARLIHAAPEAGVPWRTIESRLKWESNPEALAALCLMLGEYGDALLPGDRDQIKVVLLDLFATHPHPGVHSATEWTLKRWGKDAELEQTKTAIATAERPVGQRWHHDPQGWTFAVFDGPVEFEMGSRETTPHHDEVQQRHRRLIPRSFGIATREVTMADYLRFRKEHPHPSYSKHCPEPECSIVALKWFDAAMYCRWLSEQAGLEEHEICYPPLNILEEARNKFGGTLKLPDDLLDRPGYRLPTAAEWEYACGTGTTTAWSFGNSESLLGEYAWYDENTHDHTEPAGLLKPNDWGLFDMHGNALEWCQSFYFDEYAGPESGIPLIDGQDPRNERGSMRELRGGSFYRPDEYTPTAFRWYDQPGNFDYDTGFRIARTYPTQPNSPPAE